MFQHMEDILDAVEAATKAGGSRDVIEAAIRSATVGVRTYERLTEDFRTFTVSVDLGRLRGRFSQVPDGKLAEFVEDFVEMYTSEVEEMLEGAVDEYIEGELEDVDEVEDDEELEDDGEE